MIGRRARGPCRLTPEALKVRVAHDVRPFFPPALGSLAGAFQLAEFAPLLGLWRGLGALVFWRLVGPKIEGVVVDGRRPRLAHGRPVGAKQRIAENFVDALLKDFEAHGASAIVACREQRPDTYLTCIAKCLPKEVNLKADGSEAFLKIWEAIAKGLANRMAAEEEEQPEDLRNARTEGNA
jgi:hypothetical protein